MALALITGYSERQLFSSRLADIHRAWNVGHKEHRRCLDALTPINTSNGGVLEIAREVVERAGFLGAVGKAHANRL